MATNNVAGPERHRNGVAAAPRPERGEIQLGGALIPPGIYEAAGGRLRFETKHGNRKAVISWTVLVPDREHPDGHRRVLIPAYFNVRKNGDIPPRGALARALIMVTESRRIRRNRVAAAFLGVFARVAIVTVTTDYKQRPLPPLQQYSRVDGVVEVIAGRGRSTR